MECRESASSKIAGEDDVHFTLSEAAWCGLALLGGRAGEAEGAGDRHRAGGSKGFDPHYTIGKPGPHRPGPVAEPAAAPEARPVGFVPDQRVSVWIANTWYAARVAKIERDGTNPECIKHQ